MEAGVCWLGGEAHPCLSWGPRASLDAELQTAGASYTSSLRILARGELLAVGSAAKAHAVSEVQRERCLLQVLLLGAYARWGPSAPSLAFKTICGLQGKVLGWSASRWVLIALAMSMDPLGPQLLSSLAQACDFGRVAGRGSGPLENAPWHLPWPFSTFWRVRSWGRTRRTLSPGFVWQG